MSPRPAVRNAARAAGLLAAMVALVSGCVSIPDQGPVREVDGGRPQQVSPARIRPAGPVDGASPEEVVTGFLQAMMASPVRYDIARRFLSEGASADWQPRASVTVYSQSSVSESETNAGAQTVGLDLVREAILSDQGRFSAPSVREQHHDLTLVQEGDEWRIANPPDGAFITRSFFEGYYDSLNGYYFDAAGQQLVAEPVHLPDDGNRATYLVASLLKGPQGALGGQALTFLPDTWEMSGPVEIDSQGVARVRFSGSDSGLPLEDRERLSAQLVWSLRQIPTISAVEILIGDRPVSLPNTADVQRLDTWTQFDPAADRSVQLFALREGKLVVVGRTSISPFAGAWGSDPVEAADLRVSLDTERIALVSRDRTTVSVSPLAGDPKIVPARGGTNLLRPSWDQKGRLWTVDRTGAGSVLTVGAVDDEPRTVGLGPMANGRVTGFELSPDGARFIATARIGVNDRLYGGAIRYDADTGEVLGLVDIGEIRLPSDTGVPLSAAWRSSTTVAVLARAQQRVPQVSTVAIDSSSPVTGAGLVGLLPQDDAQQVLGAGVLASPVYVLDGGGLLWSQNSDGRWQQISDEAVAVASFAG